MGLVAKDDGWRIPDEVWERMEPLLPARPAHPLGCHRPRVPDRDAMNAILLVLRTGMQWNALNATGICSSSSAHRRFQEWTQAGVFEEFADGRSVTKPPFPRIPYDQAMLEFGSDKPDLRNPIRITDVTEHYAGSGFGLFALEIAKTPDDITAPSQSSFERLALYYFMAGLGTVTS